MHAKAICLKQPWASMVANGTKTIETRKWSTNYRGPLLIVSSLKPKLDGYPTGVAIAITELINCRKMTKEDVDAACCEVYPKAHSWILSNTRPLRKLLNVKGQLGLFDVEINNLDEGELEIIKLSQKKTVSKRKINEDKKEKSHKKQKI
jgi:hypothetical protein